MHLQEISIMTRIRSLMFALCALLTVTSVMIESAESQLLRCRSGRGLFNSCGTHQRCGLLARQIRPESLCCSCDRNRSITVCPDQKIEIKNADNVTIMCLYSGIRCNGSSSLGPVTHATTDCSEDAMSPPAMCGQSECFTPRYVGRVITRMSADGYRSRTYTISDDLTYNGTGQKCNIANTLSANSAIEDHWIVDMNNHMGVRTQIVLFWINTGHATDAYIGFGMEIDSSETSIDPDTEAYSFPVGKHMSAEIGYGGETRHHEVVFQ